MSDAVPFIMTLRQKLLVCVVLVVVVASVGYVWGRSRRAKAAAIGRVRTEVTNSQTEVEQAPAPLILLLLDVSGSLPAGQTRPGRDPHNRELQSTQTLLRLVRHFSSSAEGGFAPRVGIITFGASARWLEIDGERIWRLRSDDEMQRALADVDRMLGGTGDADRRRGTYTDYNSAVVEARDALLTISGRVRPCVVLMTDGEHDPYPLHLANVGPDESARLERLAAEMQTETLQNLEILADQLPAPFYAALVERLKSLNYQQQEPLEYLMTSGRPQIDNLPAQAAEEAWSLALEGVRQVRPVQRRHSSSALQSANRRLHDEYLPRLAELADLHIVGLSPLPAAEASQRPATDPDHKMWRDLQEMVRRIGQGPERLRWCNDVGLVQEFLAIFEQWLRLLRQTKPFSDGNVEIGSRVESLAVLALPEGVSQEKLKLSGPDGKATFSSSSLFGQELFLLHRPLPGSYRLESAGYTTGSLSVLIQTDPLFQIVLERHRGSIDLGPPAAVLAAFSASTGHKVPFHEFLEERNEVLSAKVLDASGSQIAKAQWRARRDDEQALTITYELDPAFWNDTLACRPGRYTILTELAGFKYCDGSAVTPQQLASEFSVEPGVSVTFYDAEGFKHHKLAFPPRAVRLQKN